MARERIGFTLILGNEELEIETFRGEFRNLMDLINEKIYVEDFGECKGIGRCGTCLITFVSSNELPEMDRNEKATLAKAEVSGTGWRLSCQIMVDDLLQGTTVTIAEDRPDVR